MKHIPLADEGEVELSLEFKPDPPLYRLTFPATGDREVFVLDVHLMPTPDPKTVDVYSPDGVFIGSISKDDSP